MQLRAHRPPHLAYKPGHVEHLEAEAKILRGEFGVDAGVLDSDSLAAEIGTPVNHGGLLYERSGGLHPAKFFAGLARLARGRGAQLHDGTPAIAIDARQPGGFTVKTPRGDIAARNVLLATNGYSDGLVPSIRRRIIPIGSYIIATEPLSADRAPSAIPNPRMLFVSKNFLYYWRLSAGNRMLFRGRASFAPTA